VRVGRPELGTGTPSRVSHTARHKRSHARAARENKKPQRPRARGFAAPSLRSAKTDRRTVTAIFPLDKRNPMGYSLSMIKSFAHKGLERLFNSGSAAGVQAIHARRLRQILALLNDALCIEDMDAPGLRLHPLKGDLKGLWAVTVQANWRVTFRFENGDAYVVDYQDYH